MPCLQKLGKSINVQLVFRRLDPDEFACFENEKTRVTLYTKHMLPLCNLALITYYLALHVSSYTY